LPLVFGAKPEECLSEGDSEFASDTIERLYQQIYHSVLEGKPKVPASCRLHSEWQQNFSLESPLSQWCEGFLQGHMGLIDWWEEYLAGDEELQEALGMAVIILGFYANKEESENLSKLAFGEEPVFEDLSLTMRSYMAGALKTYADIGQQLYQEHNEDQELRRIHQDIKTYEQSGDNVLPFPYNTDNRGDKWQAQQLVFAAWESKSAAHRIELANEALELDPNCVDAYMILANDAAENRQDILNYLRQGVDAGERDLGDTLSEGVGHFWNLPETRPYMRARYGYAETLWELGKREESIAHFEALLVLNPEDNQGVRYMLLSHHIEMADYDSAQTLLARFVDDDTALWEFPAALLSYIAHGDVRVSRNLRRKALQSNAHVAAYLASDQHLPKQLPDYYGVGDENEAIVYAWYNRKLWRNVDGAMAWLLSARKP
jgi:tetratricopeptide (TPR) repeat protein